jgi:hypothetical protein
MDVRKDWTTRQPDADPVWAVEGGGETIPDEASIDDVALDRIGTDDTRYSTANTRCNHVDRRHRQ